VLREIICRPEFGSIKLGTDCMPLSKEKLWERFKKYYVDSPKIGVALDISRMDFADDFSRQWHPKFKTHFCRTRMAEKISDVGLGRWPNNIKQHAYMQHVKYVFNKGC